MKRKMFSGYISGLLYGGLILIGLNCSADRIIKSEDYDHKYRKCEDHQHELNLPFMEDWSINQKSDNEISLKLRILDKKYKLEFTYANFYKREVTYNYTPGMHEYPGTRISEGDWRLYETKEQIKGVNIISEKPYLNKVISISSSNNELIVDGKVKTDKEGIIKIPIKSKDPNKVIGKIVNKDKPSATDDYYFLARTRNDPQISFYGTIKVMLKEKIFNLDGHKLNSFYSNFLIDRGLDQESFDVYYINADKIKEEKKKEREIQRAEDERKKERDVIESEGKRIKSIIKTFIEGNLEKLIIKVVDDDTGLRIGGAGVSITSNAISLEQLLIQKGFRKERMDFFDRIIYPYTLYPNSWNGEDWGKGSYHETNPRSDPNFTIFKTARHKIVVNHPDYYEFIDEFIPEKDGLNQEIRMAKVGTKFELNLFGGKGKRVKR